MSAPPEIILKLLTFSQKQPRYVVGWDVSGLRLVRDGKGTSAIPLQDRQVYKTL